MIGHLIRYVPENKGISIVVPLRLFVAFSMKCCFVMLSCVIQSQSDILEGFS